MAFRRKGGIRKGTRNNKRKEWLITESEKRKDFGKYLMLPFPGDSKKGLQNPEGASQCYINIITA